MQIVPPVATPSYPYYDDYWSPKPITPKFDLYNPTTRTKLPRFEFPQPCSPQLPSPSPFPRDPFHRADGSGCELHPILSQRNMTPNGPNVSWILFDDPFSFAEWDDRAVMPIRFPGLLQFLQQAAFTSFDLTSFRIRYDHCDLKPHAKKYATIIVNRNDADRPLTVKDVLVAISTHFMTSLDPQELSEATDSTVDDSVFDMKAIRTRARRAPEDRVRRVDTLGPLTRFGGLHINEIKDGVLEILLDLIPINVQVG
ncbi:hypothetical protein C0991_003898 [Blastosporella zonata]|nr:hypothetical protein C0991_003898 [Blastosporella zonata]